MPHVLVSKPIKYHDSKVGELYIGYQIPVNTIISFSVVICALFSLIAFYMYMRILNLTEGIVTPFKRYSEQLDLSVNQNNSFKLDSEFTQFSEINKFNSTLEKYVQKSKKIETIARQAISKAQVAKVAARVRHDVIASLVIGESVLEKINTENQQTSILKSVFERISNTVEDIPKMAELTRDEMSLAASGNIVNDEKKDIMRPCHLSAFIYQMVGEVKLSKFCFKKEIKFEVICDQESFSSYCEIEPNKFKRDLINLYKNAVEAIDQRGTIKTELRLENETLFIKISDNGKGMSHEILQKIGARGVSIGKKDGSGIGLSSAIEDVTKWGGDLKIRSEVGEGTTIEISLPTSNENFLFPTNLAIAPGMTILVVDDDPLIHELWRSRFSILNLKENNIVIKYAKNLISAERALKGLNKHNTDYLLLIDNDLKDKQRTGLEFIKEKRLEDKSVLVTSNGNSNWLYERCSQLNVPILPKAIQEHIPLEVCH